MADSSRPIAPYLPPEITFRILHFVEPEHENWSKPVKEHKLFSNFTTINSGWHQSALKRLFEGINIGTLEKLSTFTLVPPEQLLLILSITFNITNDVPTSDDAHNLFLLLKSVSNLKFLSFSKPVVTRFNSEDEAAMRLIPLLPKLITFKLQTRTKSYDRIFYDPIFVTAPDLVNLSFNATSRYEYQGVRWSPKDFSSLRTLSINHPCILAGRVWRESLKTFTGLEFLSVDVKEYPNMMQFGHPTKDLTKALGHSLKTLKQKGIFFGPDVYSDLISVSSFELHRSPPPEFEHGRFGLMPAVTTLSLGALVATILPITSFPKLETLAISMFLTPYDLSQLPRMLSNLIIGAIRVPYLLQSMENLEAGMISFETLGLGNQCVLESNGRVLELQVGLLEDEDVKNRCEELGIKVIQLKRKGESAPTFATAHH